MGDYAHINCRLTIKDEYIKMVEELVDDECEKYWDSFSHLEFLKEFIELDRHNHIPFLDSSSSPWEKTCEFLPIAGTWNLTCSSKGFMAILYFVEKIVPEICLTAEIKYTDDFMYNQIEYKLENGVMVKYGVEDWGM